LGISAVYSYYYEDQADGDSNAGIIRHYNGAVSVGYGSRQRQPHAYRLGHPEQRQLQLDGDHAHERQRLHHHPRRLAGHRQRHADCELHA